MQLDGSFKLIGAKAPEVGSSLQRACVWNWPLEDRLLDVDMKQNHLPSLPSTGRSQSSSQGFVGELKDALIQLQHCGALPHLARGDSR